MTRSPDAIQREIEQTRAELADTIDAIADRISPKRAASRGAHAVKSAFSSNGHANGQSDRSRAIAPTAYTSTTTYRIDRKLRTDRVLLAAGAAAAVAGALVLWRSRRR